jgi:iron complex outermembrane receptor protein
MTVHASRSLSLYASLGVNSREPARSDMLGGFDNLDTSNVAFVNLDSSNVAVGNFGRVRPERAHDLEAGVHYDGAAWSLEANAFAMEFRNEILPVGQLSYIGTPLRTNVRSSWRRGVETDFTARPHDRVRVGMTLTAMRANIANFTDDETGQTYRDVEPLLTPKLLGAQRVSVDVTRDLSVTVNGRYSSRAQLTNTGDPALRLPAYYAADVSGDWTRGRNSLSLYVNNAANSRRYASGHVSFGEARYYVLPPLSVFLLARIGM